MKREWIVLDHGGGVFTVRVRLRGESYGDTVPSGNHSACIVAIFGSEWEARDYAEAQ